MTIVTRIMHERIKIALPEYLYELLRNIIYLPRHDILQAAEVVASKVEVVVSKVEVVVSKVEVVVAGPLVVVSANITG